MDKVRIAYVINHVAFFVSHRLPLAKMVADHGFEVSLFTGRAGSVEMEAAAMEQLGSTGIKHRRSNFKSSGIQPFSELLGLIQLIWFVGWNNPDIFIVVVKRGIIRRHCGADM